MNGRQEEKQVAIFGTSTVEAPNYLAAISGDEMMAVLRRMGFAPELSHDSQGDPLIKFQVEGMKTLINFYNGTNGRYESLQFFSGFNDKVPLQKINEFAQQKRFARVYLDANETINIEWDVALDGGVRKEFLEETVLRWKRLLQIFGGFFSE
jgi:hypothetical protein